MLLICDTLVTLDDAEYHTALTFCSKIQNAKKAETAEICQNAETVEPREPRSLNRWNYSGNETRNCFA